jgi:hypothetical protein
VKRDNPGIDLLLTADWSDIRPSGEGADVEPPPALGAMAEPVAQPEPQPAATNWSRGALWVAVVFAGGLVLVTGTIALRSRKPAAG